MFDKDNKFGFINNSNNSNNNIEGLDKVKTDINNIKDNLGNEELTTNAKDVKGAVNELNTQYKDIANNKADKVATDNIQQQVNNLVLGAVGDGNNAEVVQARGEFSTLNDRIKEQDNKLDVLDKVTKVTYRNISKSAIEVGSLSNDTGDIVADQSYIRTQSFIKVIGGKTIYVKRGNVGANAYEVFEYDASFKFIKKDDVIYDYEQTDHVRTLVLQENTRYIKFRAWWTEAITGIKVAVYYAGCGIVEYEDYTEPATVVKGTSVDNSVGKPVVCFNFDMINIDNRFTALQKAGFTGTWQFESSTLADSKGNINTLIKNGHDISPYTGLTDKEYQDVAHHTENIAKLKAKVVQILEDMKKLGIYNPVMFSCAGHRGGYVVSEAVKDLNFKYIRCGWGVDVEGKDYYVSRTQQKPNDIEQYPLPLAQYKTFNEAKVAIDNLIAENASLIMPMCHTVEYDGLTETDYFENLVNYIKTLSDKGVVKVMNMREYYECYYPEQGKKDDRVRIMSAINDIKNLHLS